jgi:HKD family nuclease
LNILPAQESKYYEPQPKYPQLFKALIPVEKNAPEWVHKMYSDKPNIFEIEKVYLAFYNSNNFEKSLHTQNYKHLMK